MYQTVTGRGFLQLAETATDWLHARLSDYM